MPETSSDVITRYLHDAIATEKGFEAQLQSFAKDSGGAAVKPVFQRQAAEARRHSERLSARLESLGGSRSAARSVLAQLFSVDPKNRTRNLMATFALENSGMAMYASLAAIAGAAGDSETAELARDLQAERKTTAETIWNLLGPAALAAKS